MYIYLKKKRVYHGPFQEVVELVDEEADVPYATHAMRHTRTDSHKIIQEVLVALYRGASRQSLGLLILLISRRSNICCLSGFIRARSIVRVRSIVRPGTLSFIPLNQKTVVRQRVKAGRRRASGWTIRMEAVLETKEGDGPTIFALLFAAPNAPLSSIFPSRWSWGVICTSPLPRSEGCWRTNMETMPDRPAVSRELR